MFGNRSIVLTDLSGNQIGTPQNPLYVVPVSNQVGTGPADLFGADHCILLDASGNPVGISSNILSLVEV